MCLDLPYNDVDLMRIRRGDTLPMVSCEHSEPRYYNKDTVPITVGEEGKMHVFRTTQVLLEVRSAYGVR